MDQLNRISSGLTGGITSSFSKLTTAVGMTSADERLLAISKGVIDEPQKQIDKKIAEGLIEGLNSSNPDVVSQACVAFAAASEKVENRDILVNNDALLALFARSRTEDMALLGAVVKAMWHFVKCEDSDDSRGDFLKAGGLDVIAKLVTNDQPSIQYASLRTILHICESQEYHTTILKHGLVYSITGLLNSSTDEVVFVTASILVHLVEADSSHPAFVDESFLGTLGNLATEGTDNVKYATFGIVRGFRRNEDTLKKLAACGVTDALINNITSQNERLQYIALSTLSKIPAIATERMAAMVSPVLLCLKSDRPSIIGGAARFIQVYITQEELKKGIIKRNDYLPFVNAIESSDSAVQNAGALALNAVLKVPEAALAFVTQGGIESIKSALEDSSESRQAAGVTVLWPLSFSLENHPTIAMLASTLISIAATNTKANARLLASLTLSQLKQGEDEVQSFLKMHPHKERPIGYEFSRADVEAIDAMFFRTHDAGQLLAVWCLAYISQFAAELFVQAKGYDLLDAFGSSGKQETVAMASMVLEDMDLTENLKPNDASELLDFFLGDVKTEIENVEKLKEKRNAIETDLRVKYRKRENIDKLPLFQELIFVSSGTNQKLTHAAAVRQKIDSKNSDLLRRLEAMDPLLPPLQREIDVFKGLFAKEEDKEKIRSLKQQIAEANKQTGSIAGVIDIETKQKTGFEGEKRSLLGRMAQKEQREKERVVVVSDMSDVQYQLDTLDSSNKDMDDIVDRLNKLKEDLEKQMTDHIAAADQLSTKITANREDILEWERKMRQYDDLRATVDRFKSLRREVKEKYGEELNSLTEFHALLGGLMASGYAKLRQISGEATPRDGSLAKDTVNGAMDFGSKAEVELDERVAELYSELTQAIHNAKKTRDELGEALKANETKRRNLDLEIERTRDKLRAATMRRSQMPTREKLESLKKDFQINLEKLEKEIADLASLEKDITVLNEKIDTQTKSIAQQQAHKRQLDAEIGELERQLKQIYAALEGDLGTFADSFARFKKARATFQRSMRPLLAETTQWKKLFEEEKKATKEAYTALYAIVTDIQSIVDGLKNAKEDELFVQE